MSTDIETAFHTSLDRLLRGEATLDACLAAYPEHDDRLRDMLVVALDLQALAPLPLDRSAVERGARLIDDELQRLRARIDRQPEPTSAWERLTWWFPRFMPVRMAGLAAACAIALIAYGGVTLAAVNSGPDSALYGYRLTLEELRIGFATDEEKAYLYLDTAEQRLREIESAAGTGDAGAVARASTAYQEVVRKGVNVLGAVARDPLPGAERTGEVAADYRRRLAEHDTRFDSLSTTAAAAEREPITHARTRAQAGLRDVHSGPILAAAPTATPDPSPAPTTAVLAPVSSPSPTPAAVATPPASPTPASPTATPQASPEPTATVSAAPVVDITGSAVVVTGELHAVTDDSLVVAGIPIARGEVAAVDGVPLTARVRAETLVAADGGLTLVALSAVQPAPGTAEAVADSQPTAAPDPSPSPEPSPTPDPTPAAGTPTADASPTPAEGEPTATPDPASSQGTAPGEASPSPTPADAEASPTPESTPGEGAPQATEEAQPPSEPSPTPTPADGEPSPTPEATPSPEATPTEGTPPPTDEAPPTPEPSVTPVSSEVAPTATPEATPTPDPEPTPDPTPTRSPPPATPEATPAPDPTPTDVPPSPTPTEGEPTVTLEATPSPDPTPGESAPPTDQVVPEASPTPTPVTTEPPVDAEPTPAPDVQPPVAPLPPTLQGVLVAIDSFTVRAGGIVFSRPLDTPLVLHAPMAPGDVVVVTFEALRAASSYVLVAREIAPLHPPDGPVITRWQGFVDELAPEALKLNGVRLQIAPAVREDDVWAALEVGALVEVELSAAASAEPVAAAVRLLGSGAAQSFNSLAGLPQG